MLSVAATAATAISFWLASSAAVAFVVDDPGPGEGGRPASLGLLAAFVGLTLLIGRFAWLSRSAWRALRSPGSVTIEGDVLRIDAPGVIEQPVELHRAWVRGAESAAAITPPAASFCNGFWGQTCVVELRQPVGTPTARRAAQLPKDLSTLPNPAAPVQALALDIHGRDEAVKAIDTWARATSATRPGEPPQPADVDHRHRNLLVVAWILVAAGLASTFFTLPA
ncbi:MAG: hypothetical protein ACTHN0_05060 [Aquihabitans sp.]